MTLCVRAKPEVAALAPVFAAADVGAYRPASVSLTLFSEFIAPRCRVLLLVVRNDEHEIRPISKQSISLMHRQKCRRRDE